ncbi:DUF551 domain-containing protein [Citrobacter portucalensis]|uniref:DUF551 domain-containing protein n=1 Tax=Citrobacter portucalensis TaxID=1639133 RepID=UPI001F3253F5|nr:DUF551 domain-containing protein [Citrobacter portucalensis]
MTTNNHPAHGPVSLDRLHQISEILSKASAQSDGGNLGYAMADAVKVIDMAIAVFGAEPAGYADPQSFVNFKSMGGKNAACTKEWMWRDPYNGLIPLYTAPPAPVSVPDAIDNAGGVCCEVSFSDGWNACRADMLQAGNHTERRLDMVDHSGDTNENVDCRLTFDQWLSQQNEPIDVDCGCVSTEAFYHWLRVAYEDGNSPVTPDGWISVSERMPEREAEVQVYCADTKEQMVGYMERNEAEGWFRFASLPNGGGVYCKPTHWMSLPAAPQQEVK